MDLQQNNPMIKELDQPRISQSPLQTPTDLPYAHTEVFLIHSSWQVIPS